MAKALVTGVGGFIGSRLAGKLCESGHVVVGIDSLKTGFEENVPTDVEFIIGDCADSVTYEHPALKFGRFDIIFHIAGQSSGEISFDDPVSDLHDNCVSTLRLLEFARSSSCKKIIFASSMSVYGDVADEPISEDCPTKPLSMYAVGKLASEHYLRLFTRYGIDSVSLRLFNVYGPGQNMSNLRQGMASIYLAQAIRDKCIEVKGAPDRFRDFVYIDDVVTVCERCIELDLTGTNIFNVCTGVKTKVSDVVETIKKALGEEGLPVNYAQGTPGDQFGIFGDNSNLKSTFGGLEFVEFEEGIRRFVSHLDVFRST